MENKNSLTKERAIKILETVPVESRYTYLEAIINDENADEETIHIWTEALDELNEKEDEKFVELLTDYSFNPFPNFERVPEQRYKNMSYASYKWKEEQISKRKMF